MSREVVVVSGVRTAIGTYGGSLKDTPPTELAALVVREALARAFERARRAGEIPPSTDVDVAAASVLAIVQGLAVLVRVNPDPAMIRGVLQTARQLVHLPAA